ncbi:hypothetical protein JXA88_12355 [Candidatus Fermentibacteria bacterium]|nr:hypothetical protein [Candidatus Fermentibacteria bacterium]
MRERILVAAFLLACVAGFPVFAQGPPYPMGHRTITFHDSARNDRAILTEIYYPGVSAGDNVPTAEPTGEGFPVVTFGHGYLMTWSAYENIWSALVPEGYVVALPRTEGGLSPGHLDFGLDLAFLVSRLRIENAEPSSPFHGVLAEAAAIMGHSMGGGAAVLGAGSDSTITALANLAAAETSPSAIAAAMTVFCPSLVVSGSYDGVAPPGQHQIPIYAALSSPCKTYLSILGGSHCQFAESNFYCELGEIGAPTPSIDRPTQHALVSSFLVPWLDFHLKGDHTAWHGFEALLFSSEAVSLQHECDIVPPAPPEIVSISRETLTVTLTWRQSPFATGYHVYGSTDAFHNSPGNLDGVTADTSWSAIEESVQRFYRITAVKGTS